MPQLLGIDLGTSSVKTALVDVDTLRVLADASQEYPVNHPRPGYAEQSPDDWWHAVTATVRAVLAEVGAVDVRGIGLSGQMHGTVCLDEQLHPIRPAIIWADARSHQQVARLAAVAHDIPNVAGPPAVGFMASTLMWLAQHEPETLMNAKVVLLPKDYLRLKLSGTIGTDVSDAASTWLLDVTTGQWSEALLELCGLESRYLPDVNASVDIVGTLSETAADELKLAEGIPVVAGSSDLPAQALGYGLSEPGTALVTVGTGGQVFVPTTLPEPDPLLRYYVFNHNIPARWYEQAAILSAGLSLRWLRDLLNLTSDPDAYETLSDQAESISPGAEGLLFLPYLAGERTPLMDATASGVFFGLRLHHGRAHLVRAVMEGVAFALGDCLSLIGNDVATVILSGGAAKSPVWRQILADVFDTTLLLTEDAPYACIGAAILAGIGTGLYADIKDARTRLPKPTLQITPNQEAVAFYRERRALYRRLYPLLKEEMAVLQMQV